MPVGISQLAKGPGLANRIKRDRLDTVWREWLRQVYHVNDADATQPIKRIIDAQRFGNIDVPPAIAEVTVRVGIFPDSSPPAVEYPLRIDDVLIVPDLFPTDDLIRYLHAYAFLRL